jgi:hypothetical protein
MQESCIGHHHSCGQTVCGFGVATRFARADDDFRLNSLPRVFIVCASTFHTAFIVPRGAAVYSSVYCFLLI